MKDYKYHGLPYVDYNTTLFYIRNNMDHLNYSTFLLAEVSPVSKWYLWGSNDDIFNNIPPISILINGSDAKFIMETHDETIIRLFVISLLKNSNNDK
jgi:hypothetical protein